MPVEKPFDELLPQSIETKSTGEQILNFAYKILAKPVYSSVKIMTLAEKAEKAIMTPGVLSFIINFILP